MKCSCGKTAGPTGLCTDCFLNHHESLMNTQPAPSSELVYTETITELKRLVNNREETIAELRKQSLSKDALIDELVDAVCEYYQDHNEPDGAPDSAGYKACQCNNCIAANKALTKAKSLGYGGGK